MHLFADSGTRSLERSPVKTRPKQRRHLGTRQMAAGALVLLGFQLLLSIPALAQSADEDPHPWIGREAAFEEALLSGTVVEKTKIGHGVTRPVRVVLEHEGQTFRAIWKPLNPKHHGENESFEAEIAAYRLSRALGLDMVPPTVRRRLWREHGSLQLWIEDVVPFTEIREDGSPAGRWPLQAARMSFFDYLIDNPDRNTGNFLIDLETGRLFLVDHSRALNFGGQGRNREKSPPNYLDRYLTERLMELSDEDIEALLGDILRKGQIKGVVRLRDQMLEHASSLNDRFGQEAFFVASGSPPKPVP